METKKLTCCDLMVGDYVYSTFSDKPCKVQAIELSEHEYCSVRVSGVEGVKDIVSLSPIPLTAEILEKNGFEEDDYYLRYTFYFDNRRVRSRSIEVIPQDEDWSEIEMAIRSGMTDMTSVVEYVHELQHALRLCGVEKEIIL